MWGVFETEESVHVIPILDDGTIKEPHEIDDFCFCMPEAIEFGEDGRIIINHNEVH